MGGIKLYKVVIVDDEPMIREGLRTLIDWESLGFTVVSTAKNGIEAFKKYNQEHLDLMIVDIRMPEMDGLSLLGKIRQENTAIHFLILSGYAEFDYAKQAMASHVEDYLLKPLDEAELIEALKKIRIKLDKSKEKDQLTHLEKEKWMEILIDELISGTFTIQDAESWELFKSENKLVAMKYQIVLLKPLINDDREVHQILSEWKNRLIKSFETNRKGFVFEKNNALGIILIQRNNVKEDSSLLYDVLKTSLCSNDFIAALGKEVHEIEKAHISYESASSLLEHHFYFENDIILTKAEHQCVKIKDLQEIEINEVVDKLHYSLELADDKMCITIINELIENMKAQLLSESLIKKSLFHVFSSSLNKILVTHSNHQQQITYHIDNCIEIYNINNLPDLKQFLIEECMEIVDLLNDGNSDVIMKKVLDLIARNYQQNIRLETLAQVLNYNSAYLGKLFRNYTGTYFNTYLDQVRIDKGKKLLEKGLKVYEVSEQIGYSNVDYFHKKFKQYVGVSPSKYRKLSLN